MSRSSIGGFHVSGVISMLPKLTPELQEALDLGVVLYAGESEGRMMEFLRDMASGNCKPVYNYLKDTPDMTAATFPILPRKVVTRVAGHYTSFDAGRGCPFQCSFCTIINVQGRKSRYRTADDVEGIVRANAKQDITRFFITDDNYARNKNWEADPRSPDRAARKGRLQDPPAAAGRHAMPQDSRLHREGRARRLHRRLHRA